MIGRLSGANGFLKQGRCSGTIVQFFMALVALLTVSLGAAETAIPTKSTATADSLFSPDGYRMRQYRAPTPEKLSAATTVGSAQLQLMLSIHPNPVLVDVLRVPWRQGRFVETEPHKNIPGSIWLPAAGLGNLPQPWIDHFSETLKDATGGNPRQALVFYCKSDCWLSWNAARRADRLGYKHVYWLRDGIDGWLELGLKVADADPVAPRGAMVEPE